MATCANFQETLNAEEAYSMVEQRMFNVYVRNDRDALARICSLLHRYALKAESLSMAPTEKAGILQISLLISGPAGVAPSRVEALLYKILNVVSVERVSEDNAVMRSLTILKVRATSQSREEIARLSSLFSARVIHETEEILTIEIAGEKRTIAAVIEALRPHDITQLAETGIVAVRV